MFHRIFLPEENLLGSLRYPNLWFSTCLRRVACPAPQAEWSNGRNGLDIVYMADIAQLKIHKMGYKRLDNWEILTLECLSSSDPHQLKFYLTYLFSHPIWHIVWHSIWHSIWHLALAIEVPQCPLWSGARGWRRSPRNCSRWRTSTRGTRRRRVGSSTKSDLVGKNDKPAAI